MSTFWCGECGFIRDSDDGCEQGPGLSLICSDCMEEEGGGSRDTSAESKRECTSYSTECAVYRVAGCPYSNCVHHAPPLHENKVEEL